MRLALLAILFTLPVASARAQNAAAAPEERGVYSGSGRACAGDLRIGADSIAWDTPFSHCAASPFQVEQRTNDGAGLRVTYRLLRPGGRCRYPVLLLMHAGDKPGIGWDVVGFASLADYKSQRRETGLSCYLTK